MPCNLGNQQHREGTHLKKIHLAPPIIQFSLLILHYPLQVYNDTVNVIGMPGDAV